MVADERGTLHVTWDDVVRPAVPHTVVFTSGRMRSFWTHDADISLIDFVDALAREIVLRDPARVYMSTAGLDQVIFDAVSELLIIRYGRPEIQVAAFTNERQSMLGQRTLRPHAVG